MQVSRNDTTLAHALAKHEIEKASDKLHGGIGLRVLRSNSVKEFFKLIEPAFKGRIIDAAIGRPIGSRASATVFLCDTDTGGNLAVTQLIFSAKGKHGERVMPHPVPLIVQQHAFARLIQRITGEGDLGKAVQTIQPHLHAALGWVRAQYPMEPGVEVRVAGRGIELAGAVDEHGTLRLKTVIDAASMSHALRRAWAESDKIEICETYRPSEKIKGKVCDTVVLDELVAE